jgi:hypothetical protein
MLPFDLASFIDREEDLEFLKDLVFAVVKPGANVYANTRVVHLIGLSDIGKTRLLQRYEYCLRNELPSSCPVFVSFEEFANLQVDIFKERILVSFDLQVANYLGIHPMDENGLRAEDVLHNIESLQRDKAVVFLIDEVNTLMRDGDLVKALEEFLESCLYLPKTIFILAGRSLVTGWRNFDLRPTEDINIRELGPFNYENTELQVINEKPAAKPLVKKIFDISGGSPGNNKSILDQISDDSPQIDELDAIRACNREFYVAVGEVSNGLPEDLVVELLPALEALCVLQDFDKQYEVPVLFAAHNDLNGEWDVKRSAALFSVLANIQIGPGKLIDWDSGKSAYAIEEQTRANLERELELRDKDLWKMLHCAAMNMYARWAKDFEEYDSEVFRIKAEYHRTRLEQAGFDPTGCGMRN